MKNSNSQTDTFYNRYGKRLFDLVASSSGLALLGGSILTVALIVRIIDGKPVFFRQTRIGQNGKSFGLIKFRTMRVGSEKGTSVTARGDSRITSTGALLRKFKLDELPQLFNVFRGEMSFVGPRPDVPGYADKLEGEDRKMLDLKPGITGPATLFYKNEEELLANQEDPITFNDEIIFPNKVRMNKKYLEQLALGSDLRYIVKTILGDDHDQ